MWYLVCGLFLAIWVLVDGLKRKANAVLWALGTVFLGPIVLPLYLAKRPLQPGELREGGTTWNVLKNFAVSWTIFMAVAAVWGTVAVSEHTSTLEGEAEKAGAAIGTAIGLGMIGALWFFPFIGAVVIGFLSKKSSVVETGPAVPLAAVSTQDDSSVAPRKKRVGLAGWIAIIVLALIVFNLLGGLLKKGSAVKQPTQAPTPRTEKGGLSLIDFSWEGDRYIVGTVKNNSSNQYSYAQVEFNLYDESGAQVGSTFANVSNLEPHGTWKFKAVAFVDGASQAKLKRVSGF